MVDIAYVVAGYQSKTPLSTKGIPTQQEVAQWMLSLDLGEGFAKEYAALMVKIDDAVENRLEKFTVYAEGGRHYSVYFDWSKIIIGARQIIEEYAEAKSSNDYMNDQGSGTAVDKANRAFDDAQASLDKLIESFPTKAEIDQLLGMAGERIIDTHLQKKFLAFKEHLDD
ncbi:hypothetical protein [Delftia phage PhiW-14]|uniref:Uncharacterized protein n=1 Tax=Delftia phage PhiW-14 TaxID=665032 RepID=C9DG93_BPW14|nr:hypothetical protein DP-phiW-14_gp123 [Delftia phage PhiW-14]ACV50144.1 hypothetical protein [Delftia phage PhiW-14]